MSNACAQATARRPTNGSQPAIMSRGVNREAMYDDKALASARALKMLCIMEAEINRGRVFG